MALIPVVANYTLRIIASELPAIFFTTGTWTNTRGASATYYQTPDVADQTVTIEFPISRVLSRYNVTGSSAGAPNPQRGLRLLSVTYDYAIGVANMDAHSADIVRKQHVNAAAPTITTAAGGTLTPALSTTFGTIGTTGQYITTQALPTPIFLNPNQADEELYYVVTANLAATTTYRCYGASFNFDMKQ